jgi:hypothetical protein
VLGVAGCAERSREPASQAIDEIEAALAAAGTAPAQYIPGALEDVQVDVAGLKEAYASRKYSRVLERAPKVLEAAQALAPAAAAREAALTAALRNDWAALVTTVPVDLARAEADLAAIVAKGPSLPPGLSAEVLASSRRRLADAQALWTRAVQKQAAARMPEAVTLARQAQAIARQVDATPEVAGAGTDGKQ